MFKLTLLNFTVFFKIIIMFHQPALASNFEETAPIIFPETSFYDQNNKAHNLEQFEQSVVIVNFCAIWHNSCAREIMELDELQKSWRKLPIKIIAIYHDYLGTKPLTEYVKLHKILYLDIFLDQKNQLFNQLGLIGFPTSFIVNEQNLIIAKLTGYVNWHDEVLQNFILKHAKAATINYNQQKLLPATEPQPSLAPVSETEIESKIPSHAITNVN